MDATAAPGKVALHYIDGGGREGGGTAFGAGWAFTRNCLLSALPKFQAS